MNLQKSLLFNIEKLVGTLKDEEELKEVLKRKFTKKEFKVFVAMEEKKDIKEIATLINDEESRVEELYKSACKKLNQEKIKKELIIRD
ncbi:hypothetical protein CRV08_11875 [Halarcobacter ebronensis]|uniref:RNA polymerase sigma factor 70 region 4 type 2 domain-containing protein n=1 Tax=Halarcobacter ebronensis TaxID=1462615 RepID=A0A4Q0YCG9_9BACT|nr:hypothetical protein [Halarcobacter ebronensis]QKF83409.1 hypothetical protein AEBR_2958 [Halarcobacter ebronensis]RXJ66759.1 hypothetical protein CRV08_11875 [Halarcobacter ebronensis]RXK05969.1 hypothetical protein CRV07_07815 [Halarcobacter ebronensis]